MPDLPEKEKLVGIEKGEFPVAIEKEPEIDREIAPLVKKLEQDISLTQPVTDDYGQPLVSPAAPQQPQIVLPLTGMQYAFGLKQKVSYSIRWLAEWCLRLIKIFGSRAIFRQVETKK